MERYRTTAEQTRAVDAMAAAMRKRQRSIRGGKKAREQLIARALSMPLTDKQKGRA